MLAISFKIVLVSAILLAVYYIFLEKEKVLKFNRFYLLASLVFAYTIPFISVKIPNIEKPRPAVMIENTIQQQAIIVENSIQYQWDWNAVLIGFYFLISMFFLVKSLISIVKMMSLKGEDRIFQDQKIKILENEIAPFSFLGKIYFGKSYWVDNQVDQRIFLHEKLHVQQKHSLDILLVEVLKIITWFNPMLHFYKKTMINNHEFLADENVVKNNYEIKSYQHLILDEISHHQNYQLAHQFNFYNTKKRFIMMTKTKSKLANLKKILILPLFMVFFLVFANKKTYDNQLNGILSESKDTPEFVTASIRVLEDKSSIDIEKDTIKPKIKKTEESIKEKIKSGVSEAKMSKSTDMIPPPAPVSKIEAQTEPEFPGGLSELRNKFSKEFDVSKLVGKKGLLKGTINIIISEDGKKYNATYDFEDENFKNEVQNAFEKTLEGVVWKPGTLNGKPVASSFKMPITMSFQ